MCHYLYYLVGRHVSVPYRTIIRSLRAKICTYGESKNYHNSENSNYSILIRLPLWLVIRVSGYRYRGPGFDSRRYQIF